ncbi:MAG: porin family protein [Prolixibacteraceae bacterium]
MKRIFYILIFLLAGLTSTAQKLLLKNLTTFDDKRIHFGFSLGINAADFAIDHYYTLGDNPKEFTPEDIDGILTQRGDKVRADISTLTPGFTVGMVTNLRLTESFDLRFLPGMSFGERKLVYTIPVLDINDVGNRSYYSIKSTFLDFPLLVKYKSRKMNNQRPYLIAGAALRIDISKSGQEDLVRLKPFNTFLEAGVGWDSYLQFFRLSSELKFSFGLNNVLDAGPKNTQPQVYTNALSRLSTNIFTFSFHFE